MAKHLLVLSGGGALGSVQIGCIKELLAQGYKFDGVIGVSAGALNAAGLSILGVDKTLEYWRKIRKISDVLGKNILNILWAKGYYHLRPLRSILLHAFRDPLPPAEMPFWLGYINLRTTDVTYVQSPKDSSKLVTSLISSSAIPGIMEYYEDYNVDGGVRDPIPLQFALGLEPTEVTVVSALRPTRRGVWVTDNWEPGFPRLLGVGVRALDILFSEIAWGDLEARTMACKVPVRVFAPQTPPPLSSFDFDHKHIAAGIEYGRAMAIGGPVFQNKLCVSSN